MGINDSNKTDQFDNEQNQLVHNDVAYQGATESTLSNIRDTTNTVNATTPARAILIGGTDGINIRSPKVSITDPISTDVGIVVRNIPRVRQTYSATVINLVPATTPTDIFTITGSATKTIYIEKIEVTATKTAHSHENIVLTKRSTLNTLGTSNLPTIVPYDSNNSAATAIIRAYTANPTLGTLVGNMYARKINVPVQTPTNAQGNQGQTSPLIIQSEASQAFILRNNTQQLGINLNGVTWAGGQVTITIEWTEE